MFFFLIFRDYVYIFYILYAHHSEIERSNHFLNDENVQNTAVVYNLYWYTMTENNLPLNQYFFTMTIRSLSWVNHMVMIEHV